MRLMKKTLFLFAMITLTVAACATPQLPVETVTPFASIITPVPIGDGGFLSNEPCGAPCFFGITPDTTKQEDALKIIAERVDIFTYCHNFHFVTDGSEGVYCTDISIGFEDGYVSDIFFYPSEQILLKDVIEKLGQPNSLEVYATNLPEYPLTVKVDLYFDQVRAMISPAEYNEEEIILTSETKILVIHYFSRARYEYIYKLRQFQPWSGLGKYSVSELDQ